MCIDEKECIAPFKKMELVNFQIVNHTTNQMQQKYMKRKHFLCTYHILESYSIMLSPAAMQRRNLSRTGSIKFLCSSNVIFRSDSKINLFKSWKVLGFFFSTLSSSMPETFSAGAMSGALASPCKI